MRSLRHAARVFLAALACGCSAHVNAPVETVEPGYRSDVSTTQVVSAFVGGANVYIPATIAVVAGRPHTLSVYNATDQPHGFAIAALGIETTLPVGVATEIPLQPLEGRRVHRIHCQLHGAHRSATLVVLPGEE